MTHGPGHCRLRPAPANGRRSTSRPGFGCPPQRADLTFPGDTPRIPPRPRDHEPGLPDGNGPLRRAQGDERPACPAHRRTRPRACLSRRRAARAVPREAAEPPARHPAVRQEPVGRGGGGPQRQAALRQKRASALHAREQHQAGRDRGRLRAAAARPHGAHQRLRRGTGRRRRAAGRPGALRARRPHLQPTVLRHGHLGARCVRQGPVRPAQAARRRPQGAGCRAGPG